MFRIAPARTTRLVILGTSLGVGALIAGYVAFAGTKGHGLAIAVALLPASVAYGMLAQPLWPRRAEEVAANV